MYTASKLGLSRPVYGVAIFILVLIWFLNLSSTGWPTVNQSITEKLKIFPSQTGKAILKHNTTWHDQIAIEMLTDKSSLKAVNTPLGPVDRTKVALLIENRPLPYLIPLLVHFMTVIPPEWSFRFMGSPESLALMKANPTIQRYVGSKKLFLDLVPHELVPGSVNSLGYKEMNKLLSRPWFYKEWLWPSEWLFYFQDDSMICSASQHTLNDFVEEGWSYIGTVHPGNEVAELVGGFTLRYIPHMIKMMDTMSFEDWAAKTGDIPSEDRYFTVPMKDLPDVKIPNVTQAIRFGTVNHWPEDPKNMPMGFHPFSSGGMFRGEDSQENQKKAYEYCPELAIITVGRWDCQCSPIPGKPGGLGG